MISTAFSLCLPFCSTDCCSVLFQLSQELTGSITRYLAPRRLKLSIPIWDILLHFWDMGGRGREGQKLTCPERERAARRRSSGLRGRIAEVPFPEVCAKSYGPVHPCLTGLRRAWQCPNQRRLMACGLPSCSPPAVALKVKG